MLPKIMVMQHLRAGNLEVIQVPLVNLVEAVSYMTEMSTYSIHLTYAVHVCNAPKTPPHMEYICRDR